MDTLSFSDSSKATTALKTLEELAEDGLLVFESVNLKGRGKLSKVRSDLKRPEERKLSPQAEYILSCMSASRPYTVAEIADELTINPNSVRAVLHDLQTRKLVTRESSIPFTAGSRDRKLWQKV